MKRGLIITVLAFIAIVCVSCEKPPDYREKWVGTYDCVIHYWWSDSISREVYIFDVTAKGYSILNFSLRNTKENYDVCVKDDGYFFDYEIHSKISGHFFDGNSITISMFQITQFISDLKGKKR